MQSQSNEFRPQATERLFLAVVNQAISDVLENGKEAKEAERWLLSQDFDTLDRLFACPAKAGRIAIRKNESASLSPDERQIGEMGPDTYSVFNSRTVRNRLDQLFGVSRDKPSLRFTS